MTARMSFCLEAVKTLDNTTLDELTSGIEAYVRSGLTEREAETATVNDLLAAVKEDKDHMVGLIREQFPKQFEKKETQKTTGGPQKTIMGSTMLAKISNDLRGISPALLADISFRVETGKLDKHGKPIVKWRNPLIPGVGTFFRNGGVGDFQLLAEFLEAEGYLDPGAVENDAKDAGEQAIALVRNALQHAEPQTAAEREAEAERALEAEREHYQQLHDESAAEAEAERQAIMDEAAVVPAEVDDLEYETVEAVATGNNEAAIRAMGGSEQEIQDAIAQDQAEARRAVAVQPGQEGPKGAQAPDEARAAAQGPAEGLTPGSQGPQNGDAEAQADVEDEQAQLERKATKAPKKSRGGEAKGSASGFSDTPNFDTTWPRPQFDELTKAGRDSMFVGLENDPAELIDAVVGVHQETGTSIQSSASDARALIDGIKSGVDPATKKPAKPGRLIQMHSELRMALEAIDGDLSAYQDEFGDKAMQGFQAAVVPEFGKLQNEQEALHSPKAEPKANTVFTEDAATKARELLRKKLGGSQLNAGIDPEVIQAGITLAGYHIEKGARTFAAYSKAMLDDLGDIVRPYLKSWYMAAKHDPRLAEYAKEMDGEAAVDAYKEPTPGEKIAQTVAKRSKPTKAEAALSDREAKRAAYFRPGNVVESYGGEFDEVLAYNAPTSPGGSWSVKVQHVVKGSGSPFWTRVGKPHDVRIHATEPEARELAKGPVAELMHVPGELVSYTEGRADGQPFKNAPDRGVAPAATAVAPTPADGLTRAAAGGQFGVNGEWYEGGQILPGSEDTVKGENRVDIPPGYKASGEPYYSNGVLTQGYAVHAVGDRVKQKEGGYTGTVIGYTSGGPVFDKTLVKFDNGTESSVSGNDLEALQDAPPAPDVSVPVSPAAVLAGAGLVVEQKQSQKGKTYWSVSGNTREHQATLDALNFGKPFKMGGTWYRSVFDSDPTERLAAALQGSLPPPAAARPSLSESEAGPILRQYKVGVMRQGDAWIVTGKSFDIKDVIKSVGGRWNGEAWQFTGEDPSGTLAAALKERSSPGGVGNDPGLGESDAEIERRRELRQREDSRPDERADAGNPSEYVDEATKDLILRGKKFNIPEKVLREQIEDIGLIVNAHQKGKPLFLLANEAGTGKTLVLGGAIRELRARGETKFVYVTMNTDLIVQIKKDLDAYGLDGVSFHTYSELSGKAFDTKDAILIFDEAHNVKNVGGETARANKAQGLMADAKMNILASATLFENPVELRYLASTGIFDGVGGFGEWAKTYGASSKIRKFYNPRTQREETEEIIYWAGRGKKEDGAAARQWLFKQAIMTQRAMMIDPKLVDVQFRRDAVAPEWVDLYQTVADAYEAATDAWTDDNGNPRDVKIVSEIARHRENTIKRVLEGAKTPFAIAEAKKLLAAGRNVVIFVETKADRTLGQWRRSEHFKDDRLYTYEQMQEMMAEWQMEANMARMQRERPPPRPFAEFIVEIARFFDSAGLNKELPSTADQITAALGADKVAMYTGAVSNAAAAKNKADFMSGRKTVLVATMAKGGTGLSLHDTVGNRPTTQLNINLPWKATGVDQVSARTARYGLASNAEIRWLFASNIPWEANKLAPRVGARMRDMGALVKGIEVKAAEILDGNFDFEGDIDAKGGFAIAAGSDETRVDIYARAKRMDAMRRKADDTSHGFFETPYSLAALMANVSGVRPGGTLLDPSGGRGNLLRLLPDGVKITTVELRQDNRDALARLVPSATIHAGDFMEWTPEGKFRTVLMNPPFERIAGVGAQDVAHVMRAYDMLDDGGRLAAIMGEGAFFREYKQEEAFREWLDDVGATVIQLPEGAFKQSGTGVRTRMVIIDKSGAPGRTDINLSDLEPDSLREIERQIPSNQAVNDAAVPPGPVAEQERAVYSVRDPQSNYDLFPTNLELPEAQRANLARRDKGAPAGNIPAPNAVSVRQDPAMPGIYHFSSQLVEVGRRELPVERVTNWGEAAAAISSISRYAVEHFDALVTDKDGKPLAIVGSFKGTQAQTSIYPGVLLAEALRIEGAAMVWGVHNHPSGMETLSRADLHLNGALIKIFDPSTVKYVGTAAIGGGRYEATDDSGGTVGGAILSGKTKMTIPVVERTIMPSNTGMPVIDSPSRLKDVMSQGITNGVPGILFVDSQHRVTAWVPVNPDTMGWLRKEGRFDRLINSASEAGAAAAVIANPGGAIPDRSLVNMASALALGEVRVLDVIDTQAMTSAAEQGKDPARDAPVLDLDGLGFQTTQFADAIPDGKVESEDAQAVAKLEEALQKQPGGQSLSLEAAPRVSLSATGPNIARARAAAVTFMQQRFKKRVVFYRSNNPKVNGAYDPGQPGVIFVGEMTRRPLLAVLGHEVTHAMRRDRPDLYNEMAGSLSALMTGDAAFYDKLNAERKEAGMLALRADKSHEELVANIVGDFLDEPATLRALAEDNPGVFRRFVNYIVNWLDDIIAYATNSQPYGSKAYLNDVKAARAIVVAALKQYTGRAEQTDTPAFKAWFGNSKVVDAQGKPLVVYHGTNKDIATFEPRRGAIWFAEDHQLSNEFVGGGRQSIGKKPGKGAAIYPVYLRITNPLDLTDMGLGDVVSMADILKMAGAPHDDAALAAIAKRNLDSKYTFVTPALGDPVAYLVREYKTGKRLSNLLDNRALIDALKAAGVDGLHLTEEYEIGPKRAKLETMSETYAVFDPDQIKSAIGNSGAFDAANPDIRFSQELAGPFYSELARQLSLAQMKAGPAQSWYQAIKSLKGVKQSEIDWSGIHEWLGTQDGRITKDQVLGYLATNGVRLEETVLQDGYESALDPNDEFAPANAKYRHYQLPGGTNYREVLLTLPEQGRVDKEALHDAVDLEYRKNGNSARYDELRAKLKEATTALSSGAFKSKHWVQPNVVVHIRLNDRTDADGKRVLFVEEIQSDWGQAGAKKKADGTRVGFHGKSAQQAVRKHEEAMTRVTSAIKRLKKALAADDDLGFDNSMQAADALLAHPDWRDRWETSPETTLATEDLYRALEDTDRLETVLLEKRPPEAPFVTTADAWAGLALKRIIKLAVDEGYDKVAFINGEQSAARYDLAKQVDGVMATPQKDGTFIVRIKPKGQAYRVLGRFSSEQLEGAIGKDLASKVVEDAPKNEYGAAQTYSGLDLKVGGEGMMAFYGDESGLASSGDHYETDSYGRERLVHGKAEVAILPTVAKDVLRKVGGGAMETVELVSRTEGGSTGVPGITPMWAFGAREEKLTQPGFDITQAMRDSAADGVPMFSLDTERIRHPWLDPTNRVQFLPGKWLWEKLGKVAAPLLASRFVQMKMMSPELKHLTRQMKLKVQEAQETAAAVAHEALKLSTEERNMVSDIIEQELRKGVVPPEYAVRLAASMSQAMGRQTRELVALKMLSPEAAAKWDGKYLPRFYTPKLGKQIDDVWTAAVRRIRGLPSPMRGIKGSHLKSRGINKTVSANEVEHWGALGWEVRDPDYAGATPADISKKVHNTLMNGDEPINMWRDFTRQEREKMGEERDAGFRFVMGYMQTQRDIALGQMFQGMASDPKMSSRLPTEYFTVKVPNSVVEDTGVKRYGMLAGRYVAQETMSHLSQIEETQNAAWAAYRKAMGLWKEGKTVLNPATHMNNVLGNLTMAHLAGVSYHRVDAYFGAAKDLVNGAPMVEQAKKDGLFLGTMSDSEMAALLPPELRELVGKGESALQKGAAGVFNIVMALGMRKPLQAAYKAEDTFFRYVVYRDAVRRGASGPEALDTAQSVIFTYDDLPKGARMVRDLGIPFFAWTYKLVPKLLETALVYPWRLGAPIAIGTIANAAAYAIAFGSDDDDWYERMKKYITDAQHRKFVQEQEKLEQANLPQWMRGSVWIPSSIGKLIGVTMPKAVRLGMDKVTGHPLFLDVSRIFPGGDIADVVPNVKGAIPLPQPLTPSHPILTMLSGLLANRDLWTGKDLVDLNDTTMESTANRTAWIWRNLSSGLAIGSANWERGMQAVAQASGGEIKFLPDWAGGAATGIGKDGLPVQPGLAALQTIGIKIRPVNLGLSERIDQNERRKLIQGIEAELRSLARQRSLGAITDRQFEKEKDKGVAKIQNLAQGLTVGGDEKP